MKHNLRTLILSRSDVEKVISMRDALKAVEGVFRSMCRGRVQMPVKIYIHLDKYKGDFRAMPSFVKETGACAVKWVNVHLNNPSLGLPAVMAVIILSDPKTGLPLSIMDGTHITNIRTGAAGGIAAKYLARRDSKVIGLVGAGAQARAQLAALNEIFTIKEARVWSNTMASLRLFLKDMRHLKITLKPAKTVEECVRGADIIATTTPSKKPIVKLKWLKEGVHINAIGADAKGKEELEPAILKKAKVVVDSWEQASHSGEINVPIRRGLISKKDIYADIGEVVSGKRIGRKNNQEITIFDSTGLAIQDAALAKIVYNNAKRRGLGKNIAIIS